MRRLVVLEGRATPDDVPVEGEIQIGRSREADLRILDETASRRHARVLEIDGRVWIEDLDSANGVRLNGERVDGRAALFHGDRIVIGRVVLAFTADDAEERPTRVGDPREEGTVEAAIDPDDADPAADAEGALRRRIRLLTDGAAAAADAADEAEALTALFELATETLEPARATLVLVRSDGGERVVAARPEGARPPESATLRRRVVEDGEAVLVRDTYGKTVRREAASMVASRFRSKLAAPLKTAEGVLGFLVLEDEAADRWTGGDLRALAAAARQTALSVRNLRTLQGARAEARRLARGSSGDGEGRLLGEAPAIAAVREQIGRAAPVDTPVLITGATGTGKELVARRLHVEGPRRSEPFVALNGAALVEGLLESEFFGHEKGAFTGATGRREGRIREAGRGTLFLDEVGELSPALQAKLLRVLSEGTFTRVGGREVLKLQCRVVAATNRDLARMVAEGTFREDLYFRLAVLEIRLPPLAARGDDVVLLARAGIERIAARLGLPVPRLGEDARDALRAHPWPGNVRELMNVLERALVLLDGDTITAADLPLGGKGTPAAGEGPGPVLTFKEAERRALIAALEAAGGKKGRAVELLGTSWPTLNRKLRQHGLDPAAPDED
jgi:DNA-binding NtrC family response regulator/pSer/pThr/pTyr-binding forkhead associated (FHA) protein